MTPRVVRCQECGCERWAGLGDCQVCGAESPEHKAETERINRARAEAGLPPLSESEAAMDDNKMVPVNDVVAWLDEKVAENGHLGTLYTAQEVIQGVRDAFVKRFDANASTGAGP